MAKGWERSLFVCALGIVASAACSSTGVPASNDGGATVTCANPPTVEDTNLQQCTSCSTSATCTSKEPLEACCNWVAVPHDALADGINLHRYSTTNASATPDLGCLTTAAGGARHAADGDAHGLRVAVLERGRLLGVEVDVYTENTPTTPTDPSTARRSVPTRRR